MSRKKKTPSAAEEIQDALAPKWSNPNPIKSLIKLKNFKWTDKQKEFFKTKCKYIFFFISVF